MSEKRCAEACLNPRPLSVTAPIAELHENWDLARARDRGVSLSALLTEFACRGEPDKNRPAG